MELVSRAKIVFDAEPNMIRVSGKSYIFGDVHGQFFDMVDELGRLETPEFVNWVFLGDYVDRGSYGPETVCYLIAMKLRYPKSVVLLRGNHETREMTESFNFRKQCLAYWNDIEVYENIMEMFDLLPVASCVNGQ